MKHLFVLLLALLLTGCTAEVPETTDLLTQPPHSTNESVSISITQPKKLHSNRALSVYDTGITELRGIYPMGDDMLLLSGQGETLLTVLADNQPDISTQKLLPCFADPRDGTMQISENGVAYYDTARNAIVYLNTDLLEIQQVDLPESIRGNIFLSPEGNTLYYCQAQAIHALDLKTGTPRMIRGHNVVSQKLTGLYLNGQVLACQVSYKDGHSETLYLSTQTGGAYDTAFTLDKLYTNENTYLTAFRDGSVNLWLTGKPDADPWMLHVSQTAEVIPLYASDALIVMEHSENQTELSFLESATGRRTGAIILDAPRQITHVSGNDGIVWLLIQDADTSALHLYRWAPVWSHVWSPSSYYKTYYNAESPNTKELLRLKYKAAALGERYGINILIDDDPLAYQPSGCTFETEYRIAAYERDLAILEKALANFPEDFFKSAAFGTQNRKLTVSLVRNIYEGGNQTAHPGKQYWQNESAYIALILGDQLEKSFYHQLCHIIDNRVMSTTAAFDNWASLNPEGAAYANSYELSRIKVNADWFAGESRVFTDLYAMSYPREDRARILEYAMTPGNEAMFSSEIMQEKLTVLCAGIRQAFNLDDDTAYLWTQYLTTENK